MLHGILVILAAIIFVVVGRWLISNSQEKHLYKESLARMEEAKLDITVKLIAKFNNKPTIDYCELVNIVNAASFFHNLVIIVRDYDDKNYTIEIMDNEYEIDFHVSKSVVK